PDFAVGLNVLQSQSGKTTFVEITEFAEILKKRWGMESFGARTEELLRNALHVLSDNQLRFWKLRHSSRVLVFAVHAWRRSRIRKYETFSKAGMTEPAAPSRQCCVIRS